MPAKPRMRSSDSANSTISSTWLPNAMRSGNSQNAASASSQGNASATPNRWRRAMKATARARESAMGCAAAAAEVSVAAIEPRRLDQQDEDRDRVDEEAAGARIQVLAGGVADAEQDRGRERALEAAEPAARDHQQE